MPQLYYSVYRSISIMSAILFQKTWFTSPTSCSICLLYYTKKKPIKIHDASALHSHLDGQVHRTAVSQLLARHGTHSKVKSAATNQKAPKGVKLNLPISNNNFWKYALLQQPTQLSAPCTSTTSSACASTNESTSITTSKKRKGAVDESTQAASSDNDATSYAILKLQLRIDALERRETQTEARVTHFEGVIHKLDNLLSDQPSSSLAATQATHSASAPTIHNLDVSSDDDMLSVPEEDTLDNADTDNELTSNDAAESSTVQPHRSASAPTTASSQPNKRRRRTSTLIDALSTPLSKNTRAHSRR
jgi:hypothetical protein